MEMQLAASDRMSIQLQSAAATTHALLQIDTTHISEGNGNGSNQVERIKQMAKVSADAFKVSLFYISLFTNFYRCVFRHN